MSITQLGQFNGALRLLGERKLSSLTEAREPQRVLTDIWNDGAVDYCLEQGQWTFASRTVSLTYDSSIVPNFGYNRIAALPADFKRTCMVSGDQYFKQPLLDYYEGAGYIYSLLDTLYLKYVSNDAAYGGNMALWSQTFAKYQEAYLAYEACERLKQSDSKKLVIEKEMEKRLVKARSNSAMEEPTKLMPPCGWASARRGRWGSSQENPNQLIG